MTIVCTDLFERLGWHWAELQDAVYISTPVTLPCGKALDFYVQDLPNGRVRITDDGMTLFALRALGYALEDGRNVRALSHLIQPFGFEIQRDGEILAEFPAHETVARSGDALLALSAIATWERERREQRDEDQSLSREVERLLREKRPDVELQIAPVVTVRPGIDVNFDFLWGETYVDAIAPSANVVSARLRKTVLMRDVVDPAEHILYIVDDRHDRIAATREMGVISALARATRLTDFAAQPVTH